MFDHKSLLSILHYAINFEGIQISIITTRNFDITKLTTAANMQLCITL